MQVTVLGGAGKVGRRVVQQLLADGHSVVVLVHHANPFELTDQLKVVTGDVHDVRFVAAALRGSNAVISTLGSWHTPTKDILSSAMRSVIPAMQAARIGRLVSLTGAGALAPGETVSGVAKLAHKLFGLVAKQIIIDSEEHLRLLQASKLDWTVLRAGIMRRGSHDSYHLGLELPKGANLITRPAVARAMVEQLTDATYSRQAPFISQN